MMRSNPNEGRAVRRIILSASALAISAIAAGEPLDQLFAPGGHRRRWSGTIASLCNPRKLSIPITTEEHVRSPRQKRGRKCSAQQPTYGRDTERQESGSLTELTHADRIATIGRLAASIPHEVNQPITAMVTNAQAALRLPPSDEGRRGAARASDENRMSIGANAMRSFLALGPVDHPLCVCQCGYGASLAARCHRSSQPRLGLRSASAADRLR